MNSGIPSAALFLILFLLLFHLTFLSFCPDPISMSIPTAAISLFAPHLCLLRAAPSGSILPFVLLSSLISTCVSVCGPSLAHYRWLLDLLTHCSRIELWMGLESKLSRESKEGWLWLAISKPSVFGGKRLVPLLMNEQYTWLKLVFKPEDQVPRQANLTLDMSIWH